MTLAPGSADRLALLDQRVAADVAEGLCWGAAVRVLHRGEVVADIRHGHADGDRTRALESDTVYSVFSLTKAFINVLVLRAVEEGRFALTTRMSQLIPEFQGAPRDRATILHFLTHTTGMPGVWEVRPGMYLDDLAEMVAAVVDSVHGTSEPGTRCDYSPMANHVLLAEALRRTDPRGRSINEILEQDLFDPLGMPDTRLGIRPHMRERHAFPDPRGVIPIRHLSRTQPGDHGLFAAETHETVWAGAASTVDDLTRFVRMLAAGGTLEGTRILSERTLRIARRNHTGDMPNEIYKATALRAGYEPPPAYLGLGFSVRGERIVRHQFGTLTTAETYGNYGAGSTEFWVDPELDISFVAVTTGLLAQAPNIERFQRLSDMAVGALG